MSSSVLKVPDSAASRAAAHSTVPNNGIAYPAVIAPPVTQQAHVVQRRIENMLTNSKDKQAIEQYLKRTVNGRGQTFAEAVLEVIELFPVRSAQLAIPQTWGQLQQALSGDDVSAMASHIFGLTKGVNVIFMEHTPYPNLASTDHREDKPFTIPQSEESEAQSLKLYNAIEIKAKELLPKAKSGDGGAKTELGHLLRYDADQDTYKGYMLGVLIIDGKLYATCSGASSSGFKAMAESLGMQYVDSVMDVAEARKIVVKEIGKGSFGKGEEKNIVKEQVKGKEVKTGLTGTCAAPKLIWSIIDRTGGMSATTMLHASMTERWVSPLNDKSTVPIVDAHGDVVEYGSGQIVPSCKACQHLMHGLEDRLHRQLQDNLKFKLYREEELSPENIEKKKQEQEERKISGEQYGNEELKESSEEMQQLNKALGELLAEIKSGENTVLKDELFFLKNETDRLEELRFNLQAFAKAPMGNKRSAVLATIQQLKEGQHLVATMVAGIQKFWADAEKKEAAQKAKEEETSSAQKGGRSKKKIVRK